jgi:XTP/dITP diphosphohydrolase
MPGMNTPNSPLRQVVLASGNPGKLREFSALLAPLGIELIPQSQLGVSEAEEPHVTFVENALAKARHASQHTGLPALADDSGLCVAALGGAPGVYSARYAQREAGGEKSAAPNTALLENTRAAQPNRHAWDVALLVLVRSADDPQPLIGEGIWHGEIVDEPQGANGFGYDPYFYLPEQGMTAAAMAPEEKNRISHRARALQALLEKLRTE